MYHILRLHSSCGQRWDVALLALRAAWGQGLPTTRQPSRPFPAEAGMQDAKGSRPEPHRLLGTRLQEEGMDE